MRILVARGEMDQGSASVPGTGGPAGSTWIDGLRASATRFESGSVIADAGGPGAVGTPEVYCEQ